MTPRIRQYIQQHLASRNLSLAEAAQLAKLDPDYLSRMLGREVVNIPEAFKMFIEGLDLELVVVPKERLEEIEQILANDDWEEPLTSADSSL